MILKKDRGDGYVSLRSFLLDFLFPHFSRYGGYPFRELRHKFLMAQGSGAAELTAACLPEGFEMIGLPGHFFDMVGFRTSDDVVYLADCLSRRETLDKFQIGFIFSVSAGHPSPLESRNMS